MAEERLSTREKLIRDGLLRPRPQSRYPMTPEGRAKRDDQVDHLAKQLYNVMKTAILEADPKAEEDGPLEDWEEVENLFKDLFRSMAKYVLSTFNENVKLRERIRKLEGRE